MNDGGVFVVKTTTDRIVSTLKRLPYLLVLAMVAGCGSGGGEGKAPEGDTKAPPTPAASVDSSGGPITLRLKPTVGAKYKVTEENDSNGNKVTLLMNREVKSADAKSVKFETVVEDVQGNGTLVMGLKMTTDLSPLHEIRSNTTASSNPEFKIMANNVQAAMQMAPTFPEGPIKPGDKWKSSFHLPTMFKNFSNVKIVGDQNVPFDCEYLGTSEERGRKVAVITLKADAKRGFTSGDEVFDMALKIDGEFRFDIENGMMLYSKTNRGTTSRSDTNTLVVTTRVEPQK